MLCCIFAVDLEAEFSTSSPLGFSFCDYIFQYCMTLNVFKVSTQLKIETQQAIEGRYFFFFVMVT